MLHEHYNISVSTYDKLVKSGVEPIHFMRFLKLFDPHNTQQPLTKVSLLYYIDIKGSFDEPPLVPHKKIAKAIFENLTVKEQIEVIQYIQHVGELEE